MSLFFTNEQLACCAELKNRGLRQHFNVGATLGRGFADLGYEQFVVLPVGKLLSLFTGDCKNIDASDQEHLFLVPNERELIGFLEVQKIDFRLMRTQDSAWSIQVAGRNFKEQDMLWQLLLNAALDISEDLKSDLKDMSCQG